MCCLTATRHCPYQMVRVCGCVECDCVECVWRKCDLLDLDQPLPAWSTVSPLVNRVTTGRSARAITRIDYRLNARLPLTVQSASDLWDASKRPCGTLMGQAMRDAHASFVSASTTQNSRVG